MKDKTVKDEHPAYGMLMFSHVNGGNPNLFGSSVRHDHRILMTLSHGSAERHLNNDWYSAGGKIVEAEMSLTQFAEAITSMNFSPGVPVTLTYTEKDGRIPAIEKLVDKRTQYLDEFREKNEESVARIKELIGEVREAFEKKSLSKKDREDILSMLYQIENATGSHNTFMAEQFNETADSIVKEAKGEVEAFIQHKMNSLALEALAQEQADRKIEGKDLREEIVGIEDEKHPYCPQSFAEHFPYAEETRPGEFGRNGFAVQCESGQVEICILRNEEGECAGMLFLQVYLGDKALISEPIKESLFTTRNRPVTGQRGFGDNDLSNDPKTFAEHFPNAEETQPGEWCVNSFTVPCEESEIMIGVYREPEDGSEYAGTLTLQVFYGDEVIFCDKIAED